VKENSSDALSKRQSEARRGRSCNFMNSRIALCVHCAEGGAERKRGRGERVGLARAEDAAAAAAAAVARLLLEPG
jgi:hypothetical protein